MTVKEIADLFALDDQQLAYGYVRALVAMGIMDVATRPREAGEKGNNAKVYTLRGKSKEETAAGLRDIVLMMKNMVTK